MRTIADGLFNAGLISKNDLISVKKESRKKEIEKMKKEQEEARKDKKDLSALNENK